MPHPRRWACSPDRAVPHRHRLDTRFANVKGLTVHVGVTDVWDQPDPRRPRKGVRESLKRGFISGHPMVYVKVALVDGKYHPVDSSAQAFEVAASLGMQEAVPLANPVILEPIMNVTIDIPESNMDDVMSDINTKRGHVLGMESRENGTQRITASMPQAEMLHYATDLRSITQGRGTFTMQFAKYEEVPANLQQELIAKTKKAEE